jgi:acetyl-CoA decarbonylase/synthase complex subunit beta
MHRHFEGEAPGEMTWNKLANLVAGRQYQYGAAAFATQYLRSHKFLQADGGYSRVVWMSERLKLFAKDKIPESLRERIATEVETRTFKDLEKFLKNNNTTTLELK